MKALNDDLQMRSDWVMPICSGRAVKDDAGDKAHPTQKPEALLYRILLASTKPGDVVLDPFFGTGTTGAVARRLGRQVDRHRARARLCEGGTAADRCDPAARRKRVTTCMVDKRSQPRVAFGLLVEAAWSAGWLDADRREAPLVGRVNADGSIACDGEAGSIHKVGAALQGAPSCNGWTFWHVEHEARLRADRHVAAEAFGGPEAQSVRPERSPRGRSRRASCTPRLASALRLRSGRIEV